MNGATDYSVESGGNSYTDSYVDTNLSGFNSGNSNWDSTTNDQAYIELNLSHSYTGLVTRDDRKIFNLKNISAGFSKIAIPITPPTNLAGTTPDDTQQVNLTWNKSTDPLVANHVIYWKKDGCGFNCVTIDPDDNSTYDGRIVTGQNANSYVHSGLDGGSYYHYVIRAETSVGGVSTTEPAPLTNAYSVQTSTFPGGGPINPDDDPDLLVYYEFNGDLTDTRRKYNDGRYDLTAVEGATITYAASPFSENTAAYFDASNGYAYNEELNDAAEDNLFASKSFTVSVWFYADPDMPNYSSLMSSRYVPEFGNDDGNWSWQLDSNNNKLRWRAATGTKNDTEETAPTKYPAEEWSHATFVKHSDGTIKMYLNGSLIHTGSAQNHTPLDVPEDWHQS